MLAWGSFHQSVGCAVNLPAYMSGQPLVPSTMLGLHLRLSLLTLTVVWAYELAKAAATDFRLSPFTHTQS